MIENPLIGHLMPRITNQEGELQYMCKTLPSPVDLFLRSFAKSLISESRDQKYHLKMLDYTKDIEAPYLSGCFMILRVEALKEIGLFDERFFMYPEDIDLTRRMTLKHKTVYFPNVSVIHRHEKASFKSMKMKLIHMKNMIKYFNKFNEITSIADVRSTEQISGHLKGAEKIVLLAAEHRDDVSPTSLYYDVNVQGTKNVLDAMDQNGVKKIIFTSSVAVYGLNKKNPNEQHPTDPFNHYGKSKLQAEEVLREWFEKDPENRQVQIVRPTVIFGERNRGNVYNLLKQIASGSFMMIGKGQNQKSMAYVGNIVAFIDQLLLNEKAGFEIYNYVDKPDLTMNELTTVVTNKMGKKISSIRIPYFLGMLGGIGFDVLAFLTRKKFAISSVRVKKFCATTQFDASKAHANFKAPYTLSEGIERTLAFEFLNKENTDDVVFFSE